MLTLGEMVSWVLTGALVLALGLLVAIGPRSDITDAEILHAVEELAAPPTAPSPPETGRPARTPSRAESGARVARDERRARDGSEPAPPRRRERARERERDPGLGPAPPATPSDRPVVVVPELLVERYRHFQEAYELAHEASSRRLPDGSLELTDVRPGSLLETVVGLRARDRIVAVNGRAVPDGLGDAKRLYEALRDAEELAVELIRDGRPVTLRFRRQGR